MIDPEHLKDPHPMRPADGHKPNARERRALAAAEETIMRMHMFVYGREMEALHVPEAWTVLPELYPPQPKKTKITLLLDEPVAKFYRANGRGYQALMNDVLKAYAQLRLARVIESVEERRPAV